MSSLNCITKILKMDRIKYFQSTTLWNFQNFNSHPYVFSFARNKKRLKSVAVNKVLDFPVVFSVLHLPSHIPKTSKSDGFDTQNCPKVWRSTQSTYLMYYLCDRHFKLTSSCPRFISEKTKLIPAAIYKWSGPEAQRWPKCELLVQSGKLRLSK